MNQPLKGIVACIFSLLLAGCDQVQKAAFCDLGYKFAQGDNYEIATSLLSKCLNLESLSNEHRAIYLQARAWSHYSLENFEQALSDQEESFDLRPPATHREFINHASYLRKLDKFQESLDPLIKAETIDEKHGHPSMMTQYNLGWSLYELGRYEEAIEAFSKGVPHQPDYPFVFFRRGLAYDRIGETENARIDFAKFVDLFGSTKMDFPGSFLIELESVKSRYEVLRNFAARGT